LNVTEAKKAEECEIHSKPARTVNRTLIILLLAALALIVWHVWVYGPSEHGASSSTVKKSFPILLGIEIWDLLFDRHGVFAELWDVLPYFLVGIFLAGFIRTFKLAIKLRNSLIKYGFLSIFLASLVGILTPLCACGILTTAITLLFAGLPLAPVMALLVSSPLISPSSYLLTLSDLGPEWTAIRTVAAFLMGIFAGIVTHVVRNRGFQTDSVMIEGAVPRGDFHDEEYPDEELRCNCKQRFGNRVAAKTNSTFLVFLAKSAEMLGQVGKYVLVGIAVGSVVERYMPSQWIHDLFGQESALSIIWITLGTVPVFLHQISASSILHNIKESLDGTLNGGAGLAFLIGGPVTAIPTMTMLWAIFRKRVFVLYMVICLVGTIGLAYSFQYLVFVPNVDTDNPLLRGVKSISGGTSSVITNTGKYIRIVMDPGGKNMIAIYDNVVEGHGSIVFDSGFDKYLAGSAERYDNGKYIQNVAAWLEENNGSVANNNILIYNTYSGSGLDQESFSRDILSMLDKKGFTVTMTDRNETHEITDNLLEDHSQLWLFFGESENSISFSEDELTALSGFTEEGKGMLMLAGRHEGDGNELKAANQISSGYGVRFSGSAVNKKELPVSTYFNVFNRLAGLLRGFFRSVT
jgi:uncharacterized membrane protein YraQ (UPF0718 family)